MSEIIEYIKSRFRIYSNNASNDMVNRCLYTIGRAKFVGSEREQYLFEAIESMKAVKNFSASFSVSLAMFLWSRKSSLKYFQNRSFRLYNSFFWGLTTSMFYDPISKLNHFENFCNLEDSYYSTIALHCVDASPVSEDLKRVLNLPATRAQRDLYVVPNFRASGFPAVVGVPTGTAGPAGSVFLPEEEFFKDADEAYGDAPDRSSALSTHAAANAMNTRALNALIMPSYMTALPKVDVQPQTTRPFINVTGEEAAKMKNKPASA